MKTLIHLLALLLCTVTVLMGCHQTTTVILPPETNGTGPTAAPSTVSTTMPTTVPTEAPTMEPATAPTTESTTAPTVEPTTAPTAESTTAPTAEPTTAPTAEPTTTPTTEPTTAPIVEPTPAPTAEPTTTPTAEPTVVDTEPTQHPVYDISGHQIGSMEYALLDGINGKRAENKLEALSIDTSLCALARIRAYECTESFSQTRPGGRSGYSVLTDYGYAIWSDFSQQIHYGTSGLSSSTIIKGWMYNSDFSADILCADFSHIGIGVYDRDGLTYIVCFFVG